MERSVAGKRPVCGGCPLWAAHMAFLTPGQIRTQVSRMPDGATYFCIARTVTKGGGGHNVPPRLAGVPRPFSAWATPPWISLLPGISPGPSHGTPGKRPLCGPQATLQENSKKCAPIPQSGDAAALGPGR